jgi:hypothetical protein
MKWKIFLAVLATCFAFTLTATRAEAQATRTWVSGVGDDANPCSRTAPCKTFAGAISKTAAGGEINCLDPAGFGAVTLTKSITIDCTQTLGGILAASTTGVIVNGAGAVVNLRGLSINGGPPTLPGIAGVRILQAASVHIENVRIFNFLAGSPNGFGINVNPTSGSIAVYVLGCTIHGNGTASSGAGINVAPTGTASVTMLVSDTDFDGNFRGIIYAANGTTAGSGTLAITNSRFFRNPDTAITVTSGANGLVATFDGLHIYNSSNGIVITGGGVLARLGNSVIAYNGTAVVSSGGAGLQSYKNNQIDLNSNNSTPLPAATPQ